MMALGSKKCIWRPDLQICAEDGFLLLYKRIENGNFRWIRTKEEAREITIDQYQMLMQGLEMVILCDIKFKVIHRQNDEGDRIQK